LSPYRATLPAATSGATSKQTALDVRAAMSIRTGSVWRQAAGSCCLQTYDKHGHITNTRRRLAKARICWRRSWHRLAAAQIGAASNNVAIEHGARIMRAFAGIGAHAGAAWHGRWRKPAKASKAK
jgi:hypothetical protein